VHVSTDYVFGGGAGRPREPDDAPTPATVYGASKLAGEIAVQAATERSVVVRTAWVLSPHRANFLKTMLRLATERDEISVVDDQRGSPTAAGDLAKGLQRILLRLMADEAAPSGVHHFVNEGEASWAELAAAIMQEAAALGLPSARIRPISTADYPTPAKRPLDSRLSTHTLEQAFGITPRPWRESVRSILQVLAGRPARES
jgi:dTDP-4-dehydrorhamnose reductase